MTDLLLGVDVGTQMTKAVVCNLAGEVLASTTAAHPTEMVRIGWYEHDAEASWWGGFCQVTQEALACDNVRAEDIVAVGCSSMTPNMLPLDREGEPLRTAILYCDARSREVYPEILARVTEEEVFQRGGFPLTVHGGWQGTQLLWMRRHQPELYARTAKVVGTTNFLVFRLTGELVADYALARCNVPFYDQHMCSWSEEICHLLDVPANLFPDRIGYSADVAGQVTAAAARACGLLEGTPVIFGAMDTNADMVAAGVTEPGDVGLAYGTALIGTKCLDKPYRGTIGLSNNYVVPKRYLCGAGVQTGGAMTRWFRDAFGAQEKAREADGGPNAFAALSELAEQVPPGSEGLILLPLFGGERCLMEGRLAPGMVLGLSTFHGRAHLYRAMLEGTAYEMRRQLERIAPQVSLARVSSVGGGTQNRAWTEIMSDVLGAEQRCFPETSGAPFGDAYLAGLGVGLFSDFESLVRDWVTGGYTVTPCPDRRQVYDEAYVLYLNVLAVLGVEEAG
jgi:xylulokinase